MSDPNGVCPIFIPGCPFCPGRILITSLIVLVAVTCPDKETHYSRNDAQSGVVTSRAEDMPTNWKSSYTSTGDPAEPAWISRFDSGGPSAALHQNTAKSKDRPNIKLVSPDGYSEGVYDWDGNLITDPRDVGTYNFSPSGTLAGSIGHLLRDVVPYWFWGNSKDDPTPLGKRIFGGASQ